MSAQAWMSRNLRTQGYCLSDAERRSLAVGLRFAPALCLSLIVTALVLESATLLFALSVIGVFAGFTPRHPFDHLWNHGVRRIAGGPPVPPNPPRRRHSFKIATAWILTAAILLAAGATTAGLVTGALLVAACGALTTTNLCLPSEALAWRERRATRKEAIAT